MKWLRWLRWTLIGVAALAGLAFGAAWWALHRSLPRIDGSLPARPPDQEELTEIGAALGLGSSLTRFRAAVTERGDS